MHSKFDSEYAWNDDSPQSNDTKSESVSRISLKGKTLNTGTYLSSGREVTLTSTCPQSDVLFRVIAEYFATEHFNKAGKGTKKRKMKAAHEFVLWLNDLHDKNQSLPNNVLGEFQTYIVKKYKIKPHSSGASEINSILNAALDTIDLRSNYNWIKALLRRSKFISHSQVDDKQSSTLTSWFQNSHISKPGNIHGIEALISPKRLIESFRLVISELLTMIMDAREAINNHSEKRSISKLLQNNKSNWSQPDRQIWADDLYATIGRDGTSAELKLISEIDLLKISFRKGHKAINGLGVYATRYVWFGKGVLERASEFEQILAAWLISSLSVQPEDVWKLSSKNIRLLDGFDDNEFGFQIAYRKGRGKKVSKPYTTDVVSSQSPHGKALLRYFELQTSNQDTLFDRLIRAKSLSNPYAPVQRIMPAFSTLLVELISSDLFQERASRSSKKYKSSLLFHKALIRLFSPDAITHSSWKMLKLTQGLNDDVELSTYHKEYEYALPDFWFWNEHIKNTANHAQSDNYREHDILISRSHTSAVEGSYYMTDENKDWVNQAGRATRLVLNDIESSVFKPNLTKVHSEIANAKGRVKIMKSLNAKDGQVKSIHSSIEVDEYDEPDAIVVIENVETAVYFLHYISEVESQYKKLREENANYFYFECLPTSEWMSHALSMMSDKVTKEAKDMYKKVQNNMPRLFGPEMLQKGIQ